MKTIRIIILSILLIFIAAPQVNAACEWENKQMSDTPGVFFGGCTANEKESEESLCSGKKPTYGVCCCETAPAKKAEALFKVPDLQITIPGLDKFTQPTDCETDAAGNKISCKFTWIQEYMAAIYKYGFNIIGIIATIILMVGGVIWLTSAGNASQVDRAKKMIGGAVTGIVILFASVLILSTINPNLVNFLPLELDFIQAEVKKDGLAMARGGGLAGEYSAKECPTEDELATGVKFYATGYYKPKWGDTHEALCDIGMNCTCPNGRSTIVCEMYHLSQPYYQCNPFPEDMEYCNIPALSTGDIAADQTCLKKDSKICVTDSGGKKTTYTVKDSGGAIKKRRIDIWSGSSLSAAYNNTGVVTVKGGACQ